MTRRAISYLPDPGGRGDAPQASSECLTPEGEVPRSDAVVPRGPLSSEGLANRPAVTIDARAATPRDRGARSGCSRRRGRGRGRLATRRRAVVATRRQVRMPVACADGCLGRVSAGLALGACQPALVTMRDRPRRQGLATTSLETGCRPRRRLTPSQGSRDAHRVADIPLALSAPIGIAMSAAALLAGAGFVRTSTAFASLPSPAITTQVTPPAIAVGNAGSGERGARPAGRRRAGPDGFRHFRLLLPPGDPGCTARPLLSSIDPLDPTGAGASSAVIFRPSAAGTYRVTATYGGDSAYAAGRSACSDPHQPSSSCRDRRRRSAPRRRLRRSCSALASGVGRRRSARTRRARPHRPVW